VVAESKNWTLEDEEEDDAVAESEASVTQNGAENVIEEDVDPLDAYMQVIIYTTMLMTLTLTLRCP